METTITHAVLDRRIWDQIARLSYFAKIEDRIETTYDPVRPLMERSWCLQNLSKRI